MSIVIKKPGILTTVQDTGRFGFRRFGINPGGAMDLTAVRLVNTLLGNAEDYPVLEMHYPAPEFIFETETVIAIGGGDLGAALDGKAIANWRRHNVTAGSVLTFTGRKSGNRSYLAVSGGLRVDKWFGSSSTNLAAKCGGFEGRKLQAGDRIDLNGSSPAVGKSHGGLISNSLIPLYRPFPTVRVITGGEFDQLAVESKALLFAQNYVVTGNSNRMGYRLTGEPLSITKHLDLVSSPVSFGTIQLLPDGQLVILMADHQTTGGYPRIAHVISRDLPLLAQLGPSDKVAFHLVEIGEAEALAAEFDKGLNFLRIACKFQANL